jgi:hypothetical protein
MTTYFIAVCTCGVVMRQNSLTGQLIFNEHGWGVWSDPHPADCELEFAWEADWEEVSEVEYKKIVQSLYAEG